MTTNVTVRLLLTNKEAGIIIGSKGATIEEIRTHFEVKVGISEHVEGCVDRICSLHGPLEDVAKSCDFIADKVVKNHKLVRCLLSHFVIGTLIGKQGMNVKELQESINVRVSCLDDLLPQSTDRIVLVIGDQIETAIVKIYTWIKDANSKNIYYDPCKLENNKGALFRSAPKIEKKEKDVKKEKTTAKKSKSSSSIGKRHINIPKSLQDKVLGDKDVNLKQIGYDSGVKFEKEYKEDGVLVVTIIGETEQLNDAFQMIKHLSDE